MRAARAPDCVELWERYRDGLGESSPQARFGEQGRSRCSALATLMQRVGVGAYSHLFPRGQEGPSCLSPIYIQPLPAQNSACSSLLPEMSYFKCLPLRP